MGKTYKASITVSCLKEHTCVACGSKFAYPFTRKVTGEAANEEQAVVVAQQAANKAAENEVDLHACPNCGVVQPEMIAHERSARFWVGLAVAVVGVLVALILGLTDVITIATSAYIATGVMGLVLIWSLLGCLYNPNKDLEANRMASQANVTEAASERWGEPAENVGGLTAAHWAGLLLLAVGVLAAIAPVLLAGINGWVQNSTTYPAVCGPGDKPCIYFDKKIKSVKGYWQGSVIAAITNFEELGLANANVVLKGETKNSSWGDTISGKSVSNNTKTMWAKVELPDDPSLEGKTAKLSILVLATYPFMVGNAFDEKQEAFEHDTEVTLSSPKSGEIYKKSWWMGQTLVLVLSLVASGILLSASNSLSKQGNPTSVSPLETEPSDPAE